MMAGEQTYYEILGVGGEASSEEIRAAFRKVAREHHPDRFQGSARADAEHRFQAITEAYNVLIDSEQRARYDQTLAAGKSAGATSSPKEIARALLAKAVGFMKTGEATRANEFFSQAAAHDPQNPQVLHLYGMFLAQQPGKLEEGVRRLDQAAKLDPLNVRVLLDASRLFARAKMFARAARLANSAAELAPGDPTVESWLVQLKEATARGEAPRDPSKGGGARP